jgi:hypothetical protein
LGKPSGIIQETRAMRRHQVAPDKFGAERSSRARNLCVFDPNGQLVYHGRIDDRFPALGQERPTATSHELKDVIDAMLAGKSVPYATAPAVGCRI